MDKLFARHKRTVAPIGVAFLCVGLLAMPGCAPMESSNEIDNKVAADEIVDTYQPQQGIDSKQRFRVLLELLASGNSIAARAELELYLQEKPNNSRAQDMLKQIDTPATEYFTQDYRELTLSSGQSLSSVAKSYLGSVYKFHALAKYNGISEPGKIGTGQTIRVPLTDRALEAFEALENAPLATIQDQNLEIGADSSIEELLSAPQTGELIDPKSIAVEPIDVESATPEELIPVNADLTATADVEEMHLEALNAYRAQDLSKAIELWDRVLEIDPEYESSRLYRSQAIKLQKKLRNFD